MAAEYMVAIARILTGQILSALDGWGAAIVDGGTDSGVMRVMGRVRDATSASFPLIGVAAMGNVIAPGIRAQPDAAELEPHHTHFVLVPGAVWGGRVTLAIPRRDGHRQRPTVADPCSQWWPGHL
jgi:hypothetical protein